jgi:hypothetical protein
VTNELRERATSWLKLWDKHLWGINASYGAAEKMMGIRGVTGKAIAGLLFDRVETVDSEGEVHSQLEWRGTITYWKCPDYADGPKKPTTSVGANGKKWRGPSTKQWDALKLFVAEHKAVLMEPGTTVAFAIRFMRRHWLPANSHIVNELFTLRKIPIRSVPQ